MSINSRIAKLERELGLLGDRKSLDETYIEQKIAKMTKEERRERIRFLVNKANTEGVPPHLKDRWERLNREYSLQDF